MRQRVAHVEHHAATRAVFDVSIALLGACVPSVGAKNIFDGRFDDPISAIPNSAIAEQRNLHGVALGEHRTRRRQCGALDL